MPPVRTRTYSEASPEESAQRFAADAAEAAQHGWVATSQAWDGPTLTVVYQPEQPHTPAVPAPEPAARSTAPTVTISVPAQTGLSPGGIGVIVGAAVVAVGAFLPWATVTNGFVSVSQSGVNGGDGFIALFLAAAMALAGLGTRRGGASWITALIASALALGLGLYEISDVNGRVADSASSLAFVQVGIGLWIVAAGGAIGALASLGARQAK